MFVFWLVGWFVGPLLVGLVGWIICHSFLNGQGSCSSMLLSYLRNDTKFRDTSYQFRGYRLSILEIPVIDFENTGEGTFSKIWARLRAKSKILREWGILKICLNIGSRIKPRCKISIQSLWRATKRSTKTSALIGASKNNCLMNVSRYGNKNMK